MSLRGVNEMNDEAISALISSRDHFASLVMTIGMTIGLINNLISVIIDNSYATIKIRQHNARTSNSRSSGR